MNISGPTTYRLTQLAENQVKKETEAQLKLTETKKIEEYINRSQ